MTDPMPPSPPPQAHVVGVQVGLPRTVPSGRDSVATSIFKQPVIGRVAVTADGLAGNRQADPVNHGGVNKAVYAYPVAHYATWARELGRERLEPGQFGENLTVAGIDERDARLGERWTIGDCVLEVAQPRKPCAKLGLRMGDPGFVKTFLHSGRPGIYLAVIRPGSLAAGDAIVRNTDVALGLTVFDVWALSFDPEAKADPGHIDQALAWPRLGPEWMLALTRRKVRDA